MYACILNILYQAACQIGNMFKIIFVSVIYSIYARAMRNNCRVHVIPYLGSVMVNFKAYLSLYHIR